MAHYPGRKHKAPDYNPLLMAHRIVKVELTTDISTNPRAPLDSVTGLG
jgi:hypothetical protein